MPAEPPVPWTVFSEIQENNDPSSVDQALGREEALDQILDEIVANPSVSEERIYKRFRSLSRNRRSKYCYRRDLDWNRGRPDRRRGGQYFSSPSFQSPAPNVFDVFEDIARAELVTLVRSVLPQEDFHLLWEIAEGISYRDLAYARAVSIATIKARVFRIRERIRTSAVGEALRAALD